ncbi:hypothetical protein B0J11DRAFT_614393 [Dendryphion nanum]|uniref:Uncharacterized protein n=1 Tax=Dendryphion nanum TaxID=256645 RepID=A0A9P9DXH7_9PLEO|nr:hypothetical protein B0J11DRAFT_614393 [Dendryphion nanum]
MSQQHQKTPRPATRCIQRFDMPYNNASVNASEVIHNTTQGYRYSTVDKSVQTEPEPRPSNTTDGSNASSRVDTTGTSTPSTIKSNLIIPKHKCILCHSSHSQPRRPITNNPYEIGLLLKPTQWNEIEQWAKSQEELEKIHAAERKQAQPKLDALMKRSIASLKVRYSEAQGLGKEMFDLALKIDEERSDTRRPAPAKEIDEVWNLWLVPSQDQKNTKGFSEPLMFNIPLHSIPQSGLTETPLRDGYSCERKRAIWLCLNARNQEQWDALRMKTLSGKDVSCDLVDASGSLRLPTRLRSLGKTALISQLARRVNMHQETNVEKRVDLRLCVLWSQKERRAREQAALITDPGWRDVEFETEIEELRRQCGVDVRVCEEIVTEYKDTLQGAILEAVERERRRAVQALRARAETGEGRWIES